MWSHQSVCKLLNENKFLVYVSLRNHFDFRRLTTLPFRALCLLKSILGIFDDAVIFVAVAGGSK